MRIFRIHDFRNKKLQTCEIIINSEGVKQNKRWTGKNLLKNKKIYIW
jgi:hypothetical protein